MMNLKEFSSLSENYNPLDEQQRLSLEKITYRYPYFQAAYALYLKSLKEQEKFNFDLILKKTAVITPQRITLYNWLYNEFKTPVQEKSIKAEKPKEVPKLEESTLNTILDSEPFEITETIREFQAEEKTVPVNLTFLDWIEWTKNNKQSAFEATETKSPLEDKFDLIDTFLKNNPKIPPVSSSTVKDNLAKETKFNKEELMTETLAKVYVKQGKFKKALLAYKILSLKYPEKNSFFADQIKAIKDLQQK